jgi:hypothetical protein
MATRQLLTVGLKPTDCQEFRSYFKMNSRNKNISTRRISLSGFESESDKGTVPVTSRMSLQTISGRVEQWGDT